MEVSESRPFRLATGSLAIAVLAVALTAVTGLQPPRRRTAVDPADASQSASYTSVLGLGDSVVAAAACSCTSFVSQLGSELEHGEGHPVAVVNAGVKD